MGEGDDMQTLTNNEINQWNGEKWVVKFCFHLLKKAV